jgi:hypothetical protein
MKRKSFVLKADMMKHVAVILMLVFSMFFVMMSFENHPVSAGWYGSGYTYRVQITIDNTKVENHLNWFPMLFNYTSTGFKSHAQADGDDFVFCLNSTGAKLAHEIESYNSATGYLRAWVNVTRVNHDAAVVIDLYYGNATTGSNQNHHGVWDGNYVMVQHLDGAVFGADSTKNHKNMTISATTLTTSGKVGSAQLYDAAADKIYTNDTLSAMTLVTYECWVKFSSSIGGSNDQFMTQPTNDPVIFRYTNNSLYVYEDGVEHGVTGSIVGDTNWHHIFLVFDGTNGVVYCDKVKVKSKAATTSTGVTYAYYLGDNRVGSDTFTGTIDEARVSNNARNWSWVNTSYNNQNSPSTFYSVGSQYPADAVVPSAPVYFEALSQNNSWIRLNWTKGAGGADKITIRGLIGSYPSLTTGSTIYNGTLNGYNHTGLSPNVHWFYRCYSWNTGAGYNATSIRGHDTTMGGSIINQIKMILNNCTGNYTLQNINHTSSVLYESTTYNDLPVLCRDSDWMTYDAPADICYVQYTKSIIFVGDYWMIKDDSGYHNVTINNSLMNFNPSSSYITFKVVPSDKIYYYITDSLLGSDTLLLYSGSLGVFKLYEEGIMRNFVAGAYVNFTASGNPLYFVYVDDDFNAGTQGWGINHFSTIQDGVDAVYQGGTVYVWNGTYSEAIIIQKPLQLIGNGTKSGIENTIITYDSDDWSLMIDSTNNVSVSNFNFTVGFYGGLRILYSSDCIISGNYFSSSYGASIGVDVGDGAKDCIIYNNYFNTMHIVMNNWSSYENRFNISKVAGENIIGGPYLGGNYFYDNIADDIGNGFTIPYSIYCEYGGTAYDYLPLSYYFPPFCIITQSFINATGSNTSMWNGTSWLVNVTAESQLNLSFNLTNATESHYAIWNSGTGFWDILLNATGNTTGLTWEDHHSATVWSHAIKLLANNSWYIYDNDTGVSPNINLLIDDPNPGNSTHLTNYLKEDAAGLTTSVDVRYRNFTIPPATMPGDYSIPFEANIIGMGPTIENDSGVYANVWGNTTGQPIPGNMGVGQYELAGNYMIMRSYLSFDTSSIPAEAVINSAHVQMAIYYDFSDTDFNVTIQNVKSPAPHNPLVPGDYNKGYFSGSGYNCGFTNTSGYGDGDYFNVSLNATGLIAINKSGNTDWVVRSNQDIIASAPGVGVDEWMLFCGPGYSPAAYRPYLIVNYTIPSSNWIHFVNLTWYSNSSGAWLPYYVSYVNSNGTVTVPAVNFSSNDTYFWNVSYNSNHANQGDTQVFTFETVTVAGGGIVVVPIPGGSSGQAAGLTMGMLVTIPLFLYVRRRKKRSKGDDNKDLPI